MTTAAHDTMYVCICQAVTDKQIRRARESGAVDLDSLAERLGVGTNCGSCATLAEAILQEACPHTPARPRLYVPGAA